MSLDEGRKARDEGLAHVAAGANAQWIAACDDAIHYVALTSPFCTSDDVWLRLDETTECKTRDGRAMGSRMRAAAGKGWIRTTDRTRPTERTTSHARPLRIWRSKIYIPSATSPTEE